jgi:exportin-7
MKNNRGFGFLNNTGVKFGKYRTYYYHTLGKLLFMEIKESSTDNNQNHFNTFMMPFQSVMNDLSIPISNG